MINIGIITASDKGYHGEREDTSGQTIKTMLGNLGRVKNYCIVPDDKDAISEAIIRMADELNIDLVLTTGGTGLGPRDVTPEATLAVIDRLVPGIPEIIRVKSQEYTPRAMLSRAVAGLRGSTLIINLPGSQKGVAECLKIILPALEHGILDMKGEAGECGR
jgi:molybdenum cofactor synthesis domain-containing protein